MNYDYGYHQQSNTNKPYSLINILSSLTFFVHSFNGFANSCFMKTKTLYARVSHIFPFSLFNRFLILDAPQLTPTEKYLEKYKEQLKNIGEPKITTVTEISHRTIIETTPVGTVAMLYDYGRSAFVYYSNTSIPNKILNVVARKYAIQFYTPHLLVRNETEKDDTEKDDNNTDNNTKDKPKKNTGGMHSKKSGARFAKLKSAAAPAPDIQDKIEDTVDTNTNSQPEKLPPRFISNGRITDMTVLRKPPTEEVTYNKNITMTFADFKKLNNK